MHHDALIEAAIDQAVAELPAELRERIDNVAIIVVHESPAGPELFGRYTGVPLTHRSSGYQAHLPDRIELYRGPLERAFGHDTALLAQQVRVTLLHEVGHYFGMSEGRLHELGWG